MTKSLSLPASLVFALICASCGDDPVQIEKREKQKIEIVRLRGEIAVMEEKIKNMPPDVGDELAKTRKEVETTNGEIASLEKEIADLEARKRSLQADFDKYRAKYPVK